MDTIVSLLALIVGALFIVWLIWWYIKRRKTTNEPAPPLPPSYPDLLAKHVGYYRDLSDEKKQEFESRVSQFLGHVTIEGVGVKVDDADHVLVASSAIIPIFGFANWDYYRLTNVVLYDGNFSKDFDETSEQNVLGMVGQGGALQSSMVLSKPALHAGFDIDSSKSNIGIHEFVHLLDQADGAADGLPEYLLDKGNVKPWLKLIHAKINEIKANQSDIDPYGITNEAEFFAVASEYFFKRPDLLQEKHPQLFAWLEEIFQQNPAELDKAIDKTE